MVVCDIIMVLPALASVGIGLGSGFAFGTGYGAGVRFGYEDVYPYLKANMNAIANMLRIPMASSGFKLASGVTERQGSGDLGLSSADAQPTGGMNYPEETVPVQAPDGRRGDPLSPGEIDFIRRVTGVHDAIGLDRLDKETIVIKRLGPDHYIGSWSRVGPGGRKIEGNKNLYRRLSGLIR